MTIQGRFQNTQGITYYVYFRSDRNQGVNLTINEADSTIHFAPNAVEIQTNYSDSFQTIIKRSAIINLITDNNLSDYLFGFNARDIQVLIFRELELIFAGVVDPTQYTQPYAFVHDDLQINCIDMLSTLEYYNYKNLFNI
jgi:hypothetical protein